VLLDSVHSLIFQHNIGSIEPGYLSRCSYGLGAGRPASITGEGKRFISILKLPDQLLSPPSSLSNGYQGIFPWGVKRQGREADHSPPSCAEVKNGGTIHALPRTSSWRRA
jgi:hypothetical protein